MAKDRTANLVDCLRRTVLAGGKADRTDGQLLEDYLSRRDEAAMAALVRRHGPMVWGVCRRVLHNHHDAQDAFQASFLVLVRKAASVVPRTMVGNWLYGVAHQTALKARATAAKRQARERQVKDMPEPAARPEPDLWDDLEPLLDQELSRLPDKYRAAVVLCDLEGKTRKEAARQLQIPEGTLSTRLRTARTMLAKRLARHGLAVSGGALAAVLSQKAASAGVPALVASSTIKAASLVAAGQAAGEISVKVAALTEGTMKAMLFTRLKSALAVVLILGILATGATILTCRSAAGQDDKEPAAEKPVEPAAKQEKEEEAFTVWGEEAGGLQAGLGYLPGQHRAYQTGETVTLAVRVRNVSKEAVKFQYLRQFFMENPPAVTDGEGKRVEFRYGIIDLSLIHVPVDVKLAPEKEIELYELKFPLRPASEGEGEKHTPFYGTGKFQIQYERVFGNSSAGKVTPDPTLSKLATGKLELEVKDAEKLPEKKEEKEGVTGWGEVVGGLQAGIAFKGGRRSYRVGEVVPLVVRLRNVTDKAIAFDYTDGFFVENPPTVTDADGKPARLSAFPIYLGTWGLLHRSLAAGETVEFGSLDLALAPADAKDDSGKPTLFVAPGRYHVRYEVLPVFREAAALGSDPTKAKVLSTGTLDLEVKGADRPGEAKSDLEGAWQAVSFEQDGRTPGDVSVKEVVATFEGEKYRFTTGMRVQGAGKGTLAVHADTDPKTFEFTPDSGVFEGQAFRGIYRLEGDKLTLCFSWPVKDRPTEFASPANSTVVLAVFERRKR